MIRIFDRRDQQPPVIRPGTNITITDQGAIKTINSTGGGGGGASFTRVIVSIPYGFSFGTATVVDGAITGAEKILVIWDHGTDLDVNSPEMDQVTFQVRNLVVGQFDVRVCNPEKPVGGDYNIMYLLGS